MKTIATAVTTPGEANYHHTIETGHGHHLDSDEPTSAGGQNAGATPYELLLAALGSCTAMTLQMYAERKGWDIGAMTVSLALLKNREGETHIERTLGTPQTLTAEQWDSLLRIAGKTPVTLTLLQGATITTDHR